ncbi:Tricarboxylate transport protein TctC [plant metagenome]|uniref:Tricarboxylate transport protein TctC n=2 Tax=root TaxID=1 RepID=A0A1C3K4Q8_9BURK|nr:tripartite tricarboxylate transporter substrate binding protein [Orrella dioscoreae]SBT26385.1 Tricarboxylate transport protein TctC [Orrella dioscoreae]SOE46579.1 Tricarboxylate transport protein TctC [Orrella dioscoreae]
MFQPYTQRLLAACLGAATLATVPLAAQAADKWPTKPLRLIIPFAAGGNTDVVARLIAPHIEKAVGQTVVVENRPGAAGNIAAEFVAKADADGYTFLMGTVGTQAINYSIYKDIRFKAADFAPVTLVASVPNVLVVTPSMPVKSVKELIEYGRKNPGKLSFASSGAGSSIHLSGEMFKSREKIDMVHVPYKGSALAVTDLIGGQVNLMFDNLPTSLPHIQTGKLRALAVTSAQRSTNLPDVPTMAEAGVPNFEAGSWFGVLAPRKTSPDIIARIDDAIQKAMAQPEMQKRVVELGAVPMVKGPKDFDAFIGTEIEKWKAVVKDANIEPN